MLANAGLSDMATNVRIQGGSLGRQNLVKCWSALLRDICVNLTQAATEQQWESRQVKSVDLNEHKNEDNHRGLLQNGDSGHFEHLSRPFLSKADYFLNNGRGCYTNTPLNNVVPISSMEENLHIL